MASTSTKFKMESGIQLLARLRKKKEIQNFYPMLFTLGIKNDDLIEITSDNSTSCVLIDIISEALIPGELGGPELGVALLATDGSIQYEGLFRVLKEKLTQLLKNEHLAKKYKIESLLRKSLENFYVLEVFDITEFYCTLYNLDNIISEQTNLSLLVIDNLVSFYWSEQNIKITKKDVYQRNLLKLVLNINKEYKIPILFAKPQYFQPAKTESIEVKDNMITYKIDIFSDYKYASIYKVNVITHSKQEVKYFKTLNNCISWIKIEK